VEHDFIMATYLADRVIVYEGTPSGYLSFHSLSVSDLFNPVECTAKEPETLLTGMNRFLSQLDITFRRLFSPILLFDHVLTSPFRDPSNFRPRINKLNSVKDQEQKRRSSFFVIQSSLN
jgi:ATP-binding cassette subfamily E protein 1